MKELKLGDSILNLRQAAIKYPYFYVFRSAAALKLGNLALQQHSKIWYEAARPEILDALNYDPYAPDLLALIINMDLNLNFTKHAQDSYDKFKLVAKKSYLIEYIKKQRKDY